MNCNRRLILLYYFVFPEITLALKTFAYAHRSPPNVFFEYFYNKLKLKIYIQFTRFYLIAFPPLVDPDWLKRLTQGEK